MPWPVSAEIFTAPWGTSSSGCRKRSHLFTATTLRVWVVSWRSCCSSGLIDLDPSMTMRSRSASFIRFLVLVMPSPSRGSASPLIPAVSTTIIGIPLTLTRPSMKSLVVPATSCTMALSCFRSAFKRLDLPTLGAPAITTLSPLFMAIPSLAVSRRLSTLSMMILMG